MAQFSIEGKKGLRWFFSFKFGGARISSSAIYDTKHEAEEDENKHYLKLQRLFQSNLEEAHVSLR